MKRQKGFTLIEILIVVIILAVLASMILPRFLNQTENAYIAEAQQVLGVLRRAQIVSFDLGNGYKLITDTVPDSNMSVLGLKGIDNRNYTYSCASDGKCTALRSGSSSNGSVALDVGGTFSCDGAKYVLVDAERPSKGCKPLA